MNVLRDLDDRLFFDSNSFARHTGWLHGPLVAYANYGVLLFGLLLVLGLFYARSCSSGTLAAAGWGVVATLVAVAVNQPVTHLFHEARPYTTHPHILLLVSRSADYSFPSDHTVMAGAAATGLLLVSVRIGLIAGVAALLMAFTRVYVAAHYPWDVLAGLLLGSMVAIVGWLLLRVPLIALAGWLRRQPGLRAIFAPSPQPTAVEAAAPSRP